MIELLVLNYLNAEGASLLGVATVGRVLGVAITVIYLSRSVCRKNVLTALRCIFIHAFLSFCNIARYPQFSPPFPPCSGRGMIGKGSILPFKFFHSRPDDR